MELETVNKLFLELSQFATATTARELAQQARIAALETAAEALTEAVRDADRRYDFDCCGKLMLACREFERVVEEET